MLTLKPRHRLIVMAAAEQLLAEKRIIFVERIIARLKLSHGYRFTDEELNAAIGLALTGLIRQPAA